MTVVEFLLARIAEQQRHAEWLWATLGGESFRADPLLVELGALLDPRKVLIECEAKRAIVEVHPLTTNVTPVSSRTTFGVACKNCAALDRIHDDAIVEDLGPCDTLLALAAVYADHPDYDTTWRVT